MTWRLSTPPGDVGTFVKSRRNASDKEWAGSVLTRRTRRPHLSARRVATADEVVVLPTPPFPPTKTNLRSSSSPSPFDAGEPIAERRRESSDIIVSEILVGAK